ncbi:MAG TPA: AbrB/MazE/SpoVT family DNA-binding domain-containing protein [Anaerolineales bacterium]|nr:AbrB/MazE/SpoVT family DNA-binding domain-containing protein [Anaerolineales bacterium]
MHTRVTTRGYITIPTALRRKYGIKAGMRLYLEVDESTGQITLRPITREYIRSLRGKYKGRGLMKALMESKECQEGT